MELTQRLIHIQKTVKQTIAAVISKKISRTEAVTWANETLSEQNTIKIMSSDKTDQRFLLNALTCLSQIDIKITETDYLYHDDDLHLLMLEFSEIQRRTDK